MSDPGFSPWIHVADLAAALGSIAPAASSAALADVVAGMRSGQAGRFAGLERVRTGLHLSDFERDVLVLVGLPDEHEMFAAVSRSAHPRGEARLSVAAIVAALGLDVGGRRHLRRALESGPLVRHGMLEIGAGVPLPEASLALAPRLWSALNDDPVWPVGIRPMILEPLATMPNDGSKVHRMIRSALGRPAVLVVSAGRSRPLVELASIVVDALRSLGRRDVCIPGTELGASQEATFGAHAVALDAVPVLVGHSATAPLPDHPGLVVVCADRAAPISLDDRPVTFCDLGDRGLAESAAMWSSLVPELNGASAELASLLRVDPIRASRAVHDARATANDAVPSVDEIVDQVRQRTDRDLPPSVKLVRPSKSWSHLVATPDNMSLLRSVADRLCGQVRVLEEWGFGDRSQSGVRALFSGPPGTGKTLSAEIIAAELGLDLLVVDLSALVSKWLGETEKNISEVFDAAERCQSVLFFDECEAIFGRRTDGSDAQGRWANLETAHLLTRIDAFDGLCVLATNLRGNIDDAFVRRLDVIVDFDEPGPNERLELWRGHLPVQAPTADELDLGAIAQMYPVSGGLIRNAALAAGFAAAAGDHEIDQPSLLDAIEQEYRKAGRSFPGVPRGLARNRAGGIRHGN